MAKKCPLRICKAHLCTKRGLLTLAFFILLLIFMKTFFGSIITEGSGKIGGNVISKNRYGLFVKQNHTPVNPKSSRQLIVRSNFNVVVKFWESLSDSDRLLWNRRVSDFPYSDKFGETRYLSGYGLFVKLNMVRVNLGQSIITTPPVKPYFPLWSLVDILAYSNCNRIFLFVTPSLPAGFQLQIYASPQVVSSINYMHWDYKLIASLSTGQNYPIDIFSYYNSIFSASLQTGNCIFFKIRVLSSASGVSSHFVVKRTLVNSGVASNAGVNFSNISSVPSAAIIYRPIDVGGNVLFAGASNTGYILRSTNAGITWSNYYRYNSTGRVFYLDSDYKGIIMASCSGPGRILRSVDNGLSWSAISGLTDSSGYRCILYCGRNTWVTIAGSNGHFLRSVDNGINWSDLGNPFPTVASLEGLAIAEGILFWSPSNSSSIYRSSDYGNSWSVVKNVSPDISVGSFSYLGFGIVLACGYNSGRVYRSVNYGVNWSLVATTGGSGITSTISNSLNGIVLLNSQADGKFSRSTDFGLTWQLMSKPESQQYIIDFCIVNNSHFVFSTYNQGAVYTSNP